MARIAFILMMFISALGTASASETQHQLGAHEHGHSTLNIAIDGATVLIELEAPGHDIVGFEYEAVSDADKATVQDASQRLGEPLKLFAFPLDAGCSARHSNVEVEIGQDGHTEFHATYELDCPNVGDAGELNFPFFEAFPGARELEVNLVTPTIQKQFEVERAAPRIELPGVS